MFFRGEIGEKISGGFGEEGFTGAGRAIDKDVVVSSDGDFDGAFSKGLAADVVEESGGVFKGGRLIGR